MRCVRRPFILFFAAAAVAAAQPRAGQVGNHFSFHYPARWEYSSDGESAMLISPQQPQNKDDDNQVSIGISFVPRWRDAGNPGEVLPRATGLLYKMPGKKVSAPARFNGSESGGWIHTMQLDADEGEEGSVTRVYVIGLRSGGSAMLSASAGPAAMRYWRRDVEAIAASVSSQLDGGVVGAAGGLGVAGPVGASGAVGAAGTLGAASVQPASAAAVRARPGVAPQDAAKLVETWKAELSGHTWAARQKTFRLGANGAYEYEAMVVIAGLEESGARKSVSRGAWEVAVRDGRPGVALRPADGGEMWLSLGREGGAVVLDGDTLERKPD